ncbi:hypothetical protein ACFL54_02010 [Planctomycetota bacterium]
MTVSEKKKPRPKRKTSTRAKSRKTARKKDKKKQEVVDCVQPDIIVENETPAEESTVPEAVAKVSENEMDDFPVFDEPMVVFEDMDDGLPETCSHEQPATDDNIRQLELINRQQLVRIKELELECVQKELGQTEEEDDLALYSNESARIINIVSDMETQLETAFELKNALETDLANAQKELADESACRTELDAQCQLLAAKVSLAEHLREDIAFVEEERDRSNHNLTQITAQLESITGERDSYLELLTSAESNFKELQNDKLQLQAILLSYEDKFVDMDRQCKEFDLMKEAQQQLEEDAQDLANRLWATETSKNALTLELDTTRAVIRSLRDETEDRREALDMSRREMAELHAKLGALEGANRNLQETIQHVERDNKILTARTDTSQKELEAAKQALGNIHFAAARMTESVRNRYRPYGSETQAVKNTSEPLTEEAEVEQPIEFDCTEAKTFEYSQQPETNIVNELEQKQEVA